MVTRPPTSTPVRPTVSPAAARASASDHEATRRLPPSSRTSGVVRRSPVGCGERPATLVAVPFFIDGLVVAGQPAQHYAAAMVGALGAAGGAVLAHAGEDTRSNGRARNR